MTELRSATVSLSPRRETGRAVRGLAGLETCPSCGGLPGPVFHRQTRVPVQSCVLLESADDAERFPRGSIELVVCSGCGCIWNRAFDSSLVDYAPGYEDTQSASPRFREFARDVIAELVTDEGIHGKRVVEIGCGKGDFLRMLCELGSNSGIGVDPAVDLATADGRSDVTLLATSYPDPRAALRGDLFVCRHTLEHHHAAGAFLGGIVGDALASGDALVYLEVPDVERILCEGAFWDVYYEHCCYFDRGSFERLAVFAGLDVESIRRGFDDQYLLLRGRPARGSTSRPQGSARLTDAVDVERVARLATVFSERFASVKARWLATVQELRMTGRRASLWGAGSKAVAFLTAIGASDPIEWVVDINPQKHWKFMPGVPQQIVPPEQLTESPPDVVIVMNPAYRSEIGHQLGELGLEPELMVV